MSYKEEKNKPVDNQMHFFGGNVAPCSSYCFRQALNVSFAVSLIRECLTGETAKEVDHTTVVWYILFLITASNPLCFSGKKKEKKSSVKFVDSDLVSKYERTFRVVHMVCCDAANQL